MTSTRCKPLDWIDWLNGMNAWLADACDSDYRETMGWAIAKPWKYTTQAKIGLCMKADGGNR